MIVEVCEPDPLTREEKSALGPCLQERGLSPDMLDIINNIPQRTRIMKVRSDKGELLGLASVLLTPSIFMKHCYGQGNHIGTNNTFFFAGKALKTQVLSAMFKKLIELRPFGRYIGFIDDDMAEDFRSALDEVPHVVADKVMETGSISTKDSDAEQALFKEHRHLSRQVHRFRNKGGAIHFHEGPVRKRLADDFVIESFPPDYMDKLGLGYSALEKVNPRVIMVSISPFGQTGPYKDYKAPDIVASSMGGYTYRWGDTDRPPVRISHHSHAYLHAAGEAAVGAMLALYHREMTGKGQQVDVSIQESIIQNLDAATSGWDMMKVIFSRKGGLLSSSSTTNDTLPQMWPCQDGHVIWVWWWGLSANWNQPFIKWMEEEGMLDDFLREFDWAAFDYATATPEVIEGVAERTRKFFMARTKAELFEEALKRNVMLYPVATIADIMENAQLAARGFWMEVEHPELDSIITYPGAFAYASEVPPGISRRAPLIGEHNQEIYEKELGFSSEELIILRQAKVI